MLKVGLIGRGTISKSHTEAYAKIDDAKIVAACDIRSEMLDDLGDIRKYTDVDEFLASEAGKLDYVDICLPTYLHCEVAVKAMEAGFNVLSEKPMALNPEQAQLMCDTAKKTGKQFMVAHVMRFMGAFNVVKECIESGELGKVRSAEFYREGGSREPMGYNNWFRDEKLSGGAMLDLHIHDVDMINALFGKPEAVSAIAANVIPGSGYDAMSVHYIYPDMFVTATCDWTIKGDKFNTRAMRVNFEKGYIFLDRTKDRTTFVKVDADGNLDDMKDKMGLDMFYNEIRYYIDCLKNGESVDSCLPTDVVETVKMVMAEMKSADLRGEKVEL